MKKDDLFVYEIDVERFLVYDNETEKPKDFYITFEKSPYYNKNLEYHFLSKTDEGSKNFLKWNFKKCIQPNEKVFQYGGKMEIFNKKVKFHTLIKVINEFNFDKTSLYINPAKPMISKKIKDKKNMNPIIPVITPFFSPIYIQKEFGEKLLKEKNQDLFSYNEIKDYIINDKQEIESLICKEGQEYLPPIIY